MISDNQEYATDKCFFANCNITLNSHLPEHMRPEGEQGSKWHPWILRTFGFNSWYWPKSYYKLV